MPTIKRLSKSTVPSARKKERQQLYSDKTYRQRANWYKRTHLWCQDCLREGVHEAGTEIHHLLSPFEHGISEEEKLRRLMSEDNWVLLCKYHHRKRHHTTSRLEDLRHEENLKIFKSWEIPEIDDPMETR